MSEYAMEAARMAEQRRLDSIPCGKCGGDRLRGDFTGSGRCHADLRRDPERGPCSVRVEVREVGA